MTAAGARQRVAAPSAVLVLRRMSNTLVKLAAAAYILAWALSFTSNRPLWNLPVAVLAVVAFRWMSGRVVVAPRDGAAALRRVPRRYAGGSSWQGPRPAIGPEEGRDRDAWRRGVNAPIVESAWDALCGSVVQEFVYDSWYMSLTPDRDFPAEVRRLLNEAFADVAQRARKIDLRTVLLRELCDLFLDHLDLYRRTKQGVGLLNEGHLTPAARDRAFQQEMKTEGTLHPSMCSRDGHYRVIRCIAESIVSCSVSKCDLARPYVKALSRELVATCVLRPVLMYFNRYNASRLVLSMFPEELEQIQAKIAKRMEELVGKKELMNGHFEFEERARRAAELEAKAHKKYKYRQSRTPNHQHKEASSAEELPAEGSSVAGKSRGVDDPCEDEGTLGGEESSNRDDNASEASSALTEQRSVVSDPLSTASAPSPSRCPTCCRAPEIASPDAVGMDGMPGLATVGSSLDASSPGLQSANFEAQGEAYSSIVGWPRARVVAPEIKMDGSKEFVVFKIRVADDEGEWTVARRYRNFESLHKKLRDIPEYRALGAKLPPKHFLLQSKTTEFVQGRRVALDKYLQCVLSSGVLAFHPEVLNFLCKEHSGTYRPDADVSLLKTVASNADNVKHSLKTAVGDVLVEGKARLSGMTKSPVKRRGTSGPTRGSIPEASPNEMLPQHWSTGHLQDHPHVHFKQQDFRLSNTGQHSDALSPRAFSDGSGPLFSIGAASGTPIRDVGTPGEVGQVLNLHLSSTVPARREEQREAKGVYLRASSASTEGCLSDSMPKSPALRETCGTDSGLYSAELGHEASSLRPHSDPEDELETDWDAEFEDYVGISAPLYQVVEGVFNIPAQKFFRRQVFQAVRQLLSMLAGDVIDVYLVEQLKSLRTEHTIARMIHMLKSALWPGGKWFGSLGSIAAARPSSRGGRPTGIDKDKYLEPLLRPPDEEEMVERMRHRLITQATPAFTHLLGKSTYLEGMQDVFDMLQLPTFVTQLGYGVMEIAVLALYPELKDIFRRIHGPDKAHRDGGPAS